jgi:hypothetical protein
MQCNWASHACQRQFCVSGFEARMRTANCGRPPRCRISTRRPPWDWTDAGFAASQLRTHVCLEQTLNVIAPRSAGPPKLVRSEPRARPSVFSCPLTRVGRMVKKLGQNQKLSQRELRQFKLIPACGLKIVHEFEEQRFGDFHQIRPASLKLK